MDIKWITLGITILTSLINIIIFCVIKFNDLFHLTKEVQSIKNGYEKHCVKMEDIHTTLIDLKARFEESRKRYVRNKKS